MKSHSKCPHKQTIVPLTRRHFDQVSASSFRYQRVVVQIDLLLIPSVIRGECYVIISSRNWWPTPWRWRRRRWRWKGFGTNFWRTWRVGTTDHLVVTKVGDLNHLRNRRCLFFVLPVLRQCLTDYLTLLSLTNSRQIWPREEWFLPQ